ARLSLPPELVAGAGLTLLAGSVRFDNDLVRANGELQTQTAEQAETVRQAAERARARILAIPALSLTGFAKPLRDLSLSRADARVLLSGTIQVRTLGAALEFLPALNALRRGLASSPPVADGDAGVPEIDEDAEVEEEDP
ncbi:MAG TPA: hypothetical protein VFZ61_20635, partial [Polyangiales bacterium]